MLIATGNNNFSGEIFRFCLMGYVVQLVDYPKFCAWPDLPKSSKGEKHRHFAYKKWQLRIWWK